MAVSKDRIGFEISAGTKSDLRTPRDDEPFRIALIGDFGARARRPLDRRRPISIDPDNFDSVLSRFDIELTAAGASIPITDLDDFHPDSLYDKLPIFRSFRELRKRLANPATFPEAARELLGESPAPMPSQSAPPADLLDQILGGGPAAAAPKPVWPVDDLQSFIRAAVHPHVVPGEDPRAPELIRQVDEAAAEHMRAILHNEVFRSVECAWRTVFTLIRRLEVGTDLKLYLFDVTKEEIATNSKLVSQMLVEDADPWAVMACNFQLGVGDCALMRVLGSIAAGANAPCIAEADPSLLGDDDLGSDWTVFRRTPEAQWLGLAIPRILLRVPYGEESDECERFRFEEIRGVPDPKQMLFGNPAPFCAMLLGQAFEAEGWDLRPGAVRDIGQLPVYVFEKDGERKAFACAEVELRESTAEAIAASGMMPVAAIRGTDSVRLLRFQSVADPPAALPGRWSAR
jgi:hypothetical protein